MRIPSTGCSLVFCSSPSICVLLSMYQSAHSRVSSCCCMGVSEDFCMFQVVSYLSLLVLCRSFLLSCLHKVSRKKERSYFSRTPLLVFVLRKRPCWSGRGITRIPKLMKRRRRQKQRSREKRLVVKTRKKKGQEKGKLSRERDTEKEQVGGWASHLRNGKRIAH